MTDKNSHFQAPEMYRKTARRLRQWLKPNLSKRWPGRSMDDDLAQAAGLLDAAAAGLEALRKRRII